MRVPPVAVGLLLLLSAPGCSLIAGGSGSFTAEGETYQVSKVECRRQGGAIRVAAEAGPAAAVLVVDGATVQRLEMGAKQKANLVAQPADGRGEASVTVDGKRFRATGKLVRVDEQGRPADGPGTEEVALDVTCGSIKD